MAEEAEELETRWHNFATKFGYGRVPLEFVICNLVEIQDLGVYEFALVDAFTGCKINNWQYPLRAIRWLFDRADRRMLRAAGYPLPGPGPFTLYRGVSGVGRARRVGGLSWTDDIDSACWFASRFGYKDPAIYVTKVTANDVLTYVGDREREFIVVPTRCRRLKLSESEIQMGADRVLEKRACEERQLRDRFRLLAG